MDGYGDDLAYIHDVGHGAFALGSAPGLLHILRRGGVDAGLVVDLGCGSGLWARELTEAGYGVLGVDLSRSMIELARRRAPNASFTRASFLAVDLPPCDAVTSLGECFNYAFDERNGAEELARLFRRVHAALRPGGILVFDVAEPGQVRGRGPARRWSAGEDWAVLLEVEEDAARSVLTRRMTVFRLAGGSYRRGEEVHRLHLYRRAEVAAALERAGFHVRALSGYGRFRLPRAHAGFLATKRG